MGLAAAAHAPAGWMGKRACWQALRPPSLAARNEPMHSDQAFGTTTRNLGLSITWRAQQRSQRDAGGAECPHDHHRWNAWRKRGVRVTMSAHCGRGSGRRIIARHTEARRAFSEGHPAMVASAHSIAAACMQGPTASCHAMPVGLGPPARLVAAVRALGALRFYTPGL